MRHLKINVIHCYREAQESTDRSDKNVYCRALIQYSHSHRVSYVEHL